MILTQIFKACFANYGIPNKDQKNSFQQMIIEQLLSKELCWPLRDNSNWYLRIYIQDLRYLSLEIWNHLISGNIFISGPGKWPNLEA